MSDITNVIVGQIDKHKTPQEKACIESNIKFKVKINLKTKVPKNFALRRTQRKKRRKK